MNIRKTSSGRFEARMMINGVRYTSTQPTLEDAVNWLKVLQAQEVTGGLPLRITVEQYSLRWMTTYEGSPTSTRMFHQGNLDRHILPVLGSRTVADVTPTEIHRLLNRLKASVSVATADAAAAAGACGAGARPVGSRAPPGCADWGAVEAGETNIT